MATESIATLVFGETKTKLGSLEVACTLTENHTADVDVTEHPVEDGADITDHARKKQLAFSMTGKFSGAPRATGVTRLTQGTTPDGEAVMFNSSVSVQDERDAARRLAEARDTLIALRGELVTVVTELRTYENMTMKSLSFDRDGKTGDAFKFSASFVQIQTVALKTTRIATVSNPRAKEKKEEGKKAAPTGPEMTPAKALFLKMGGLAGAGNALVGGRVP